MHVLFLVHGMGRQQEDWSAPVTQQLSKIAKQYQRFEDQDLDEFVMFEPIRYDNLFDDLLDRWQGNFSAIMNTEASGVIPDGELTNFMDRMNEEERRFFWSHVADVLIYRFFPLYRDRVRIEVIRTIAQKVSFYRNIYGNNTRFSFLAHSLGTAVIHDSLHLLGTTEWDDEIANVMGPPHTRFQSLFMLANTSRILESNVSIKDSVVCPARSRGDQNREYLDQYFNVLHEYDPVTLLRRFSGESWGLNFRQVNLRHFRNVNIHFFSHYLDHPRVHIPLLRVLCGFRAVTPAEELNAADRYKDIERRAVISEIKNRFDAAKSGLSEESTLMDLIKVWVTLKDIIGGDINIRI